LSIQFPGSFSGSATIQACGGPSRRIGRRRASRLMHALFSAPTGPTGDRRPPMPVGDREGPHHGPACRPRRFAPEATQKSRISRTSLAEEHDPGPWSRRSVFGRCHPSRRPSPQLWGNDRLHFGRSGAAPAAVDCSPGGNRPWLVPRPIPDTSRITLTRITQQQIDEKSRFLGNAPWAAAVPGRGAGERRTNLPSPAGRDRIRPPRDHRRR